MKAYVLEIETKNRIRRITNPRKARSISLIFTTIIQVMDGTGKWKYIGSCSYLEDIGTLLLLINLSIMDRIEYINLDPILS